MDYEKIIKLVHQTRPIIMDEAARHAVTVKGAADFVTKVDTNVQAFLKDALYTLAPDVQFMAEENKINDIDWTGRTWILDPIDGTTNLIYHYGLSAVSLAYCEAGRLMFGVIYNPYTGETFHAIRRQGAWLNGKSIHVSSKAALCDSLIAVGTSPYNKELAPANFKIFQQIYEKSLDIRRSGSAALDLAYVACGRLDGYIERNLKPWDYAAGTLIVEEAGGRVTTYKDIPPALNANQDLAASNGLIHQALLSELK